MSSNLTLEEREQLTRDIAECYAKGHYGFWEFLNLLEGVLRVPKPKPEPTKTIGDIYLELQQVVADMKEYQNM